MAASEEILDPFGNDDLFAEFQRPSSAGNNLNDAISMEESSGLKSRITVSVCASSGRKHTVFIDSSASENENETKTNNGGGAESDLNASKSRTPSPAITDKQIISDNMIPVDPTCCVQVAFLNGKFADQHKDSIQEFISRLIQNDVEKLLFSTGSSDINSVDCLNFYNDFLIDQKGNDLETKSQQDVLESQRPLYEQVYRKALPCDSESEEDEDACPQTRNSRKSSCWNCSGQHSLHECKEKKDHAKISINRAAFMAEKETSMANSQSSDSRYHVDDDPRFNTFKPGRISKSLREAMGLSKNELPPYIYNMRNHGYPPGHLLDAALTASDIAMFDKHGHAVRKDGQSMEDGEVDEQAAKGGYDYGKIIEYHGFNVAPNESAHDYQDPPLNEFQLKTNLHKIFGEEMFRSIDGIQRNIQNDVMDREEEDMDLATDGTPSEHIQTTESSGAETPPTPSETLEDLESEKQRILQTLEASDTTTDLESTTEGDTCPESSDAENIQMCNRLLTPTNPRSRSMLINLGTPIGVNSELDLPDPDKFRENITEHIPYENLPNATGMFTKMMNVMGRVRETLTQLKK